MHFLIRSLPLLLLWVLTGLHAQTIDDFFDDTQLQEVRLTMAPADWQLLHERYLESTYYPASFRWRDIELAKVGVRSRGSGTRNPIKPNLGIDFSRYDSKQRFLSLKSLTTRNFAQDASMVREFLTMKIFARLGLPYLREAHARVYVNEEYAGIYLLVEPIDSRYLRSRFGEDKGYLYDYGWDGTSYRFEYKGGDPSLYVPVPFEPKTNEDAPDAERLVEMIRLINQAPDDRFAELVGEYLHFDSFLAHIAAEQFAGETDGFLGESGMANFYLYRRMADNRFVILVWDKDNTFSSPDRPLLQNAPGNVLIRRALQVPELRQRFLEIAMHATESLEGPWLAQEHERAYAQIRDAALADPYRVCSLPDQLLVRCPAGEFEAENRNVRHFVAERAYFAKAEIMNSGYGPGDPRAPSVHAGGACNLSSALPVLTPGSMAELALDLRHDIAGNARTYPLPEEIAGVRMELAGRAVPLLSVSPNRVVFQVPWNVPCGTQMLQAEWSGYGSHRAAVELRPHAPAMIAATHLDWSLIEARSPAAPGETVVLFGTGLGNPETRPAPGTPAPYDEVIPVTSKVAVTVSGKPARVIFAGLAPGIAGLAQLVIGLPAELPSGRRQPLVVIVNDEPGTVFWIEVAHGGS
jgi:uncharacterized protein (TIGR03437 family)